MTIQRGLANNICGCMSNPNSHNGTLNLWYSLKWPCNAIPSPASALLRLKSSKWGHRRRTSSFAVIMTFWALRNLLGTPPLTAKRRWWCGKSQMFVKTTWHPDEVIEVLSLPRCTSLSLHLCVVTKTWRAGKALDEPRSKHCRRRRTG